jgi:hypothetical protein
VRGGRTGRLASLVALLGAALLLAACGHSPVPPGNTRLQPPRTLPAGTLPWVGRVAIDWRRGDRPREHILIGPGGLELGAFDGPLTRYLFNRRGRAEDLRGFVRSFAPFTFREKGEELAFQGTGPAGASPAERRMIVTWAHRLVAEAVAGRGGSAYASVLSWHRSADAGGECDEVRVDLTGEVLAGPCGPTADWRGRLTDDQLRRLYLWSDAWAPFQSGPEEDQPGTPVRMIFAGRGRTAPSAAERAAVAAFAADLYRELAARHPTPSTSAPAASAASAGPGTPAGKPARKVSPPASPVSAPEPAGPRGLRPETSPAAVPPVVAPAAPPPRSAPASAPADDGEAPTAAPPPPALRR